MSFLDVFLDVLLGLHEGVYEGGNLYLCEEYSIYITRDLIIVILMLPFFFLKSSKASTQFNLQYLFQRIQSGNFTRSEHIVSLENCTKA